MRDVGYNPSSPVWFYKHLSRVDRCFSFCPETLILCGFRSLFGVIRRCLMYRTYIFIEIEKWYQLVSKLVSGLVSEFRPVLSGLFYCPRVILAGSGNRPEENPKKPKKPSGFFKNPKKPQKPDTDTDTDSDTDYDLGDDKTRWGGGLTLEFRGGNLTPTGNKQSTTTSDKIEREDGG